METDEQLRARLGALAYHVTRERGTEPAFSHPLGRRGAALPEGDFGCVCCGAVLFTAAQKFESGCGWPAFSQSAAPLTLLKDLSHGMERVEVRCPSCDAHLGHVFPDGPAPLGLRYCINGVALVFVPSL